MAAGFAPRYLDLTGQSAAVGVIEVDSWSPFDDAVGVRHIGAKDVPPKRCKRVKTVLTWCKAWAYRSGAPSFWPLVERNGGGCQVARRHTKRWRGVGFKHKGWLLWPTDVSGYNS